MPLNDADTNKSNRVISFKERLVDAQTDLARFAHKLTSDKDEVNDLVQETLLKALDNESKFLPGTNFLAWIYTIMKNLYVNKCKKDSQDQSYIQDVEFGSKDESEHGDSPDFSDYNYDIQEVYRLLKALPDEYRVPFMMYISGFKYREIADKLSMPLGTVKSHIYLTRQKLLQIFKDLK